MPQDDVAKFVWGNVPYFVRRLHGVEQTLEHAELLHEGWVFLCDPRGGRGDMLWDTFLQRVLAVACSEFEGAVFVFYSKNMKSLGFTVVMEDTEQREHRTLFIYAGYSKGAFRQAGRVAVEFVCKWARGGGFKEVRAQSRRINGAAMRYFRKELGFTTLSIVYKKDVA